MSETIRIRIKRGLGLQLGANPELAIGSRKSSLISAILGRDYPGTRFTVLTDKGTSVKAGEPVLCDRSRPEILFASPVSGAISEVHRGAKRALVSLVVTSDGQDNAIDFDIPSAPIGTEIRRLMLQSGLWPALRSRPFGCIPDPNREPKALLVTAIDTQPLAVEPGVIISEFSDAFSVGLETISNLVKAPVYLCKSPNSEIHLDGCEGVSVAEFAGLHPAGLPGTHIHELCPIGFDDKEVWIIGYQDVISLGHLMRTGRPWYERVVSLAGSGVRNPRLITAPVGAGLKDITADELTEASVRIISGSPLSGHMAAGYETYLGQGHTQVTAILEAKTRRGFFGKKPLPDTGLGGDSGPLIPITALDHVVPPGVLAVPFLRALLVGDVERARDLGALELVEEDLALLSYVCPSKTDYGPLLRDMLNQLQKEGLSIRN